MLPSLRHAVVTTSVLTLASGLLPAHPAEVPPEAAAAAGPRTTMVLLVTVDSLSPRAIRKLGPERAPNLHRLLDEGASTLNARTVRESTMTLPNHTSIVTGRRVSGGPGHHVHWNDERRRPRTVQRAAGDRAGSVFRAIDSGTRDPALFASKEKFSLFKRSWPRAVDRFLVRENNARLVRITRRDLVRNRRAFTFLHLSRPDDVGHEKRFLTRAHLGAVADVDRWLGKLMRTIESRRRLRNHLTLILTSDHGGRGRGHYDPSRQVNYRVPFLVWGVGVAPGADLYDLNGDYRNPGARRPRYRAKRPPIRNADAANLATDLLGLPVVRGSEFNVDQGLDVSR